MIDLRSDTVTRPTPPMRRAMADAEVGDDVYGEDPTARALEEEVATHFGREAAMFTPSGMMATMTLLATLCERGSEVVCESDAHVVAYEAGAGAALAGLQFRTVDGDRGRLDAERVSGALRPAMFPYTPLAAISVEETTNRGGGAIHGLDRLRALRALAHERGVPLHGDGARLFNAIVATGVTPREYGAVLDALSFCLSKGLGAPFGSMVVGDAEVIDEARVWRRRLGGGMRQVGVLAAAGRYALAHHVERLADDHANARRIAERLADDLPGSVDPTEVETNIVYVSTGAHDAASVAAALADDGVLVGAMGPHLLRLVTHLDVTDEDCVRAAELLSAHLREPVA
jgi:threonine aldolase